MSAYICTPEHVAAVAVYAAQHATHPLPLPHEIATTLMRRNIASVAYHYPRDKEGERPGPTGYTDQQLVNNTRTWVTKYLKEWPAALNHRSMANLIACLRYQSCEDVDDDNPVMVFLTNLREYAEQAWMETNKTTGTEMPDNVSWEWSDS